MAALALGLSACAGPDVQDPAPGTAAAPLPKSIRTQTYIPAAALESPGRPAQPPAVQSPASPPPLTPPAPRRHGSSTPPDLLFPPGPGGPQPIPLPMPNTDATVDQLKRNQLQSDVDRLRDQDAARRLDPVQQRDLMNRQYELDRLGR